MDDFEEIIGNSGAAYVGNSLHIRNLELAIGGETTNRLAGDAALADAAAALEDRVAATEAADAALAAADAAEALARQAADATEAGVRQTADTDEASARLAADTAETAARQAADTSEASARQAADTAIVTVQREVIDPFDPLYGAPTDGVTDGTAGWLAACAAADTAITNGYSAEVVLSKRLVLSPAIPHDGASGRPTVVRIPPNTDPAKRRVYRCAGGGHLVLSDNFKTAFQPGRTADAQTFRGIDWIDFGVDCNSVVGSGDDVLFGPHLSGGLGTLGQRINYRDLRFIRPRLWNIPAGGNGGPTRYGIALVCRHVFTNEGDANWNPNAKAQNSTLDILVEGAQIDGGDYGIAIIGGIQMGVTSGLRIKNYSGTPTVINYTGGGSLAPRINEWVHVGVGTTWERHQIAAVSDNGDGTGSMTLEAALTLTQPTEDGTGAGKGSPIVMGNVCNVWHDRIKIRGGYHLAGTGAYGSNIHLLGTGIGDDIQVEGFFGKGSGDNGIEIDSALNAKVSRCYIEDAANEGYLSRNFALPQTKANAAASFEQVHAYDECTASAKDSAPTSGGHGWIAGYAFSNGLTAGATPTFGTVRWRGCKVINHSATYRTNVGKALRCGSDCSIRRLEGDLTYVQEAVADVTASQTVALFGIKPVSNVQVAMLLRAVVAGQIASTTVNAPLDLGPWRPSGNSSNDMLCDIDLETRLTLSNAGSGSNRFVTIGEDWGSASNAGTMHGRLGLRLLAGSGGADTSPTAFRFSSLMSVTRTLRVDNCDLAAFPAAGTLLVFRGTLPLVWQRRLVVTRNNVLFGNLFNWTSGGQFPGSQSISATGGPTSYALTVTTGAFVWINETGVEHQAHIYGGSGTNVEHSKDSGSTYDAAKLHSQSEAAFPSVTAVVRPGEAVKVTNTVAPTITVTPLV